MYRFFHLIAKSYSGVPGIAIRGVESRSLTGEMGEERKREGREREREGEDRKREGRERGGGEEERGKRERG